MLFVCDVQARRSVGASLTLLLPIFNHNPFSVRKIYWSHILPGGIEKTQIVSHLTSHISHLTSHISGLVGALKHKNSGRLQGRGGSKQRSAAGARVRESSGRRRRLRRRLRRRRRRLRRRLPVSAMPYE